jgi:predicted CoA-binding protein
MSDHLVTDTRAIRALARAFRRVAVLGMKTEAQAGEPAFYVPAYLAEVGIDVVPVPVYYPEVESILGRPVVRELARVGAVDAVVVFRRSADVLGHVDALLAMSPPPGAVWMQLGITNAEAARRLAAAGIDVVQDRCLMVEHRAALAGAAGSQAAST